jgi:hypothetical protein
MDVWMICVGVQNKRISVLAPELVARKVANGRKHFVRRRSPRRHQNVSL